MSPFLPFFCSTIADHPALVTIESGAFNGLTVGDDLYVCFAASGRSVGPMGSFLSPSRGGAIVLRTRFFGARGCGVAAERAVALFSLGSGPWCAACGPAGLLLAFRRSSTWWVACVFPFLPFFCSYVENNDALETIEPGAFNGLTVNSKLYVCFAALGRSGGPMGSFLAPGRGGTIVLRTWLFGAQGSGVAAGRAVARSSLGSGHWCAACGPAALWLAFRGG